MIDFELMISGKKFVPDFVVVSGSRIITQLQIMKVLSCCVLFLQQLHGQSGDISTKLNIMQPNEKLPKGSNLMLLCNYILLMFCRET